MPIEETKTLQNLDSKVQVDVESLARIEISDVEYLLEIVSLQRDPRLQRILYETIVSKVASVFQLALRAYSYFERSDKCKYICDLYPKENPSGIGAVARFRDGMFHEGITFVEKEVFFPFGKISGRGYVAIRVKEGGSLNIYGLHQFVSNDVEYAITSEGIFEIHSADSMEETWKLIDVFPNATVANYDKIDLIVKEALSDLRNIWHDISQIRKHGDGQYEYAFPNNGAKLEIMELDKGKLTCYTVKQRGITVKGLLSFVPPKLLKVEGNKLIYSV